MDRVVTLSKGDSSSDASSSVAASRGFNIGNNAVAKTPSHRHYRMQNRRQSNAASNALRRRVTVEL